MSRVIIFLIAVLGAVAQSNARAAPPSPPDARDVGDAGDAGEAGDAATEHGPVGGYWLSAELVGDASSRSDAVTSLESAGVDARRHPIDEPPPGAFVGSVADVQTALGWVSRHAFPATTSNGEPDTLWTVDAPVPGGALLDAHGVVVRALIVSGATPEHGLRTIAWPADQRGLLPPDLPWVAAALLVDRAPLFAAPAPRVPPAVERHAMVYRSGGLFVLGWLDRCTPDEGRCLRWAQVVARRGDRFVAGYLPAYLIAPQGAWVPGSGSLPRALLVRSGTEGDDASLLLVARDRRGELHRKRVSIPMTNGDAGVRRFPATTLTVEGERAHVDAPGVERITVPLDASIDLRVRD